MAEALIKCPNCGEKFNAEEAMASHLEEKLKKEFQEKLNKSNAEFKKREEEISQKDKEIKERLEKFEELRKSESERLQKALDQKLIAEKQKVYSEVQKELSEKGKVEIENLHTTLKKKEEDLLSAQRKEIELLQQKQALEDAKARMDIEIQKTILEERKVLEDEISKRKDQENELRIKEFEKKMEDQRKLIEEMKRKSEQGSMQIQGEVQELAIEEQLAAAYPFDEIVEVGKGMRGADCIQIVKNTNGQVAGKIIYESKRTKSFAGDWVEKLKIDQRNEGADVAVLITQVLPKELDQFGFYNGIWVCQYHEFKALSAVLRDGVSKVALSKVAQENQGDKMSLLYNFMTSPEFRHQIEAIVEGFSSLKSELDREKRAMQRIWKEREKQIDKVINSTVEMYGSVRGIAGGSVQEIKGLEL